MGPVTNPYARKPNGALTNPYLRRTSNHKSSKLSHTSTASTAEPEHGSFSNRSVKNENVIAKREKGTSQVKGNVSRKDFTHGISKTSGPNPILASPSVSTSSPPSKIIKKTVSSTPPKSNFSGPSISRKVTPPTRISKPKAPSKRHVTASYKAKLKKEIQALRRQKEHARTLKKHQAAMAILDEERKQKQAAKLQREREFAERQEERQKMKEERRLEKIRLHEEKKEKLVKDLEMRAEIEREKVERKKIAAEEKEKIKLRKQQEREEKKYMEAERKRMEKEVLLRRHMTQYSPFLFPQGLGSTNNQALMYARATFGSNTASYRPAIISNLGPSEDLKGKDLQHVDAEMISAQVEQSSKKEVVCSDAAAGGSPKSLNDALSEAQRSKSAIGIAGVESNPSTNYTNTLQSYNASQCPNEIAQESSVRHGHTFTTPKSVPYHAAQIHYPSSIVRNQNISYPTTKGFGTQILPTTPVPYGIQMAYQNLYPSYALANFQHIANNYPYSITHRTPVMRAKKIVSKRTKPSSPMTIHKDPLTLPSPFVKSHHLLSFDIVLIKKADQSFGVELRYLSKGALVALEPQLNQSTSSLTSVADKVSHNSSGPPKSEVCLSKSQGSGHTERSNISTSHHVCTTNEEAIGNGKEMSTLNDSDSPESTKNTMHSAFMGLERTIEDMASVELDIRCKEKNYSKDASGMLNHSSHNFVGTKSTESDYQEDATTENKRMREEQINENDGKITESSSSVTQCHLEPIKMHREEGQSSETRGKANEWKEDSGTAERLTFVTPNASNGPGLQTSSGPKIEQHQEVQSSETSGQKDYTKSAEVPTNISPNASNGQGLHNLSGPKIEQHQEVQVQSSETSGKEGKCKEASNSESTKCIHVAKPKRKRIHVGVMSVLGATKQNKRALEGTPEERLLQTGDIILAVNGESVSGMTFQEACSLFSKCDSKISSKILTANSKTLTEAHKGDEGNSNRQRIIKCTLTVAREKKVTKILDRLAALKKSEQIVPTQKRKTISPKEATDKIDITRSVLPNLEKVNLVTNIPFVVSETSDSVVSGEFTSQEFRAIVQSVKELELASLITVLDEKSLARVKAMTHNTLQHRYPGDLLRKWVYETNRIDNVLVREAIASWKKDWTSSQDSKENSLIEYIPHSHRSEIRSYPRPPRGCKCGGIDHNFVNDPKCFLYKNLLKFAPEEYQRMSADSVKNRQKVDTSGLGAIGSAQAHRLEKRNDERKAAELEAKFVNRMEEIQIRKLKMAIFSPSLHCVLVLSAIAEVVDQFHLEKLSAIQNPLDRPNKRQKVVEEGNSQPSLYCLAKLLSHISTTWGHLYKEPGELDYAWFEECNMHVASDTAKNRFKTSPRQPGQYTYESFHFFLENTFNMETLRKEDESTINEELAIVYFISNQKTGLLHELSSLLKNDLVSINAHGFVDLNKNWARRVHPIILKDMYESGWSRDMDPLNKFCVHPRIRKALAEEWTRSPTGFKNRDCTLTHFDYDYEVKREVFENRYDAFFNEQEGIAKFGI